MAKIDELTLAQCREILSDIVGAVYGNIDADKMERILDPDNEWTPDTIQDVACLLQDYGLAPEEVISLGSIEIDCPCGDLDCAVCGGNPDWKPGMPHAR